MNKNIRRSIFIFGGIIILAVSLRYSVFTKKETVPTVTAEKTIPQKRGNRTLNVNAMIIKKQFLTDEVEVRGRLLPDEEVDLSFETSGKITEINFKEGTFIKKGQLLAKVNDASLQAQLKRLEVQLKLAEDRVFHQDALLKKEAVSKEANSSVKRCI
ncbi:Toluene efflux pump periplasmic linker protein TtgG [termite gut metagenome]|uniref:Toluene efflux pump periplasmic linker protein TtgG n=1 Tax=termite gut metagenome TaxID=433724 RepID=A0A5J4S5A6_9ZZZZ